MNANVPPISQKVGFFITVRTFFKFPEDRLTNLLETLFNVFVALHTKGKLTTKITNEKISIADLQPKNWVKK